MNKSVFFEGLVLIVFSFFVVMNDYIYDSIIGAYVNIEETKYFLGIGLLVFGILLIKSSFLGKK